MPKAEKEESAGPSTRIQPLVEAGRLDEAAAILARLDAESAPSWETCLWRARIAEKRGRWGDAQRGFLKALAARPDAVELELDFSRFLEGRGRLAAAELHLRRALKLRSRSGEVRLALARLQRRQGRADQAKEQLRLLAAEFGPAAGASATDRALLAADLAAAGRFAEAQRQLLLAADRAEHDPGAWVRGLLALARAGRLSPRLERAFRAAPEPCARSWPRVFSALLCARRYGQAFCLAEAMLRRLGPPEAPWELLWPWFMGVPSAQGQFQFCAKELARLDRAARREQAEDGPRAQILVEMDGDQDRRQQAVQAQRSMRVQAGQGSQQSEQRFPPNPFSGSSSAWSGCGPPLPAPPPARPRGC